MKNYRPVSNVLLLSKLLEKVVQSRFQEFLDSNKDVKVEFFRNRSSYGYNRLKTGVDFVDTANIMGEDMVGICNTLGAPTQPTCQCLIGTIRTFSHSPWLSQGRTQGIQNVAETDARSVGDSHPYCFNSGQTTTCLNSLGKQPEASELNSKAMNRDKSPHMSFTSH